MAEPEEGAAPAGAPEPETITIGEKEYTPEQAAALIEAGEQASAGRAENEATARKLAEEGGRLRQAEADLQRQIDDLKAEPRAKPEDGDDDVLVTERRMRDELNKKLEAVQDQLKNFQRDQDERAAVQRHNESVALIDATIEECIAGSKILSDPVLNKEVVEELIIGHFTKRPVKGQTRAELVSHIKNEMVQVEQKVAGLKSGTAKSIIAAKAGVAARVATVPRGGAPGQKEEKFTPTLKGMREWMGDLKRELEGTRPE